jgi:hypothetical protein
VTVAEPLTTGEVAAQMNAILGARCYTARHIRAEIAAGRLQAVRYQRRAVRLSIVVAPADMLAWAATVLRASECAKLRASLGLAS